MFLVCARNDLCFCVRHTSFLSQVHNIGGPWAHAAGIKNAPVAGGGSGAPAAAAAAGFFGKNSGPMCPEAVRVLLADPDRSKMLISNLLAERTREVCEREKGRDRGRGELELERADSLSYFSGGCRVPIAVF